MAVLLLFRYCPSSFVPIDVKSWYPSRLCSVRMTQLSRGWTVCGPTEYPKGIEFCLSNWQARQNATLVATVSATKTRGLTVLSGTGWGRGVLYHWERLIASKTGFLASTLWSVSWSGSRARPTVPVINRTPNFMRHTVRYQRCS